MLKTPDNKIYFISSGNSDEKPVKLIFENDNANVVTDVRKPNDKEICDEIIYALLSMKYQHIITTQQYRSEKGKVKCGYAVEVLYFIEKRSDHRYNRLIEYIETEQPFCTVQQSINLAYDVKAVSDLKYGIYSI